MQLTTLFESTFEQITASHTAFRDFLVFCGRLYKYPFCQQLLIYAQKPDATAVATKELWEQTFHRTQLADAQPILVLNGNFSNTIELYDLSDTVGERTPLLWEFRKEHVSIVQNLWLPNEPVNLENIILAAVQIEMYNNENLGYNADNKFVKWFAEQIICARLGAPVRSEFSIPIVISKKDCILGSQLAQTVLRKIEHEVKNYERRVFNEQEQSGTGILPRVDFKAGQVRASSQSVFGGATAPSARAIDGGASGQLSSGAGQEIQRNGDAGGGETGIRFATSRASSKIAGGYKNTHRSQRTAQGRAVRGTSDTQLEQIDLFTLAANITEDINRQLPVKKEFVHKEDANRRKSKPVTASSFSSLQAYTAPAVFQAPKGKKSRYLANCQAIETLKNLEAQQSAATKEEQESLAGYLGWGGIPEAFDSQRNGWEREYERLKALLTEDEYVAARRTTLNAHYTSLPIIREIYRALQNFGFQTGRILEPALGIGNFFSLLPEEMKESQLFGVEIDSISGRIARYLYPEAEIYIKGFQEVPFEDGSMDVAISNVPFGTYSPYDRRYEKYHFAIHDYYFAKSLHVVRPGGLIIFITSKGTLDKENGQIREYIAARANLIGAIRLPNNAFSENAGTEVTTDILFLTRRESIQEDMPFWTKLGETPDGVPVNQYYVEHPEMLLGVMSFDRSMYGGEKDTALLPMPGANLQECLKTAIETLNFTIQEGECTRNILAENNKEYTYSLRGGDIYYCFQGQLVKKELSKTLKGRIEGMVSIRQTALTLIEAQERVCSDTELAALQEKMNSEYDRFVKKYGFLSSKANRRAFHDDITLPLLLSLENKASNENYEKADIFTKRTIEPHTVPDHAESAEDSLTISLNMKNCVDLGYMSGLYGKPYEKIVQELGKSIFLNPLKANADETVGWEPADEYLSGNVREKLKTAQSYATTDKRYLRNVEALKAIQPKPIDATDISIRMGVPWVEVNDYNQFMYALLETPLYYRRRNDSQAIAIYYDKFSTTWHIPNTFRDSRNIHAYSTYGTERISGYRIIEDCLNLRACEVRDRVEEDGKVRYVLNKEETMFARDKQEKIKACFSNWIFAEPQRRERLVHYYNEHMNCTRLREYDGSKLLLPGMNPCIKLDAHQKNAIARIKSGNNTLLAHVVGAGKTFTMAAGAKELLRLHAISKAAFVVPNHLTDDFASQCMQLYPSFRILVTRKADFEKQNRQTLFGKIATSDIEAVVIGHSQFEKIVMSPEFQKKSIQKELDEVSNSLDDLHTQDTGRNYSVKQLERLKIGLEEQMKALNDSTGKDNLLTFEQLGIQAIFVDEAHYYKNCAIFTKMRNVAGISNARAKKSSDMLMKTRYITEELGKSVIFSTGTPISNSIAETYVMQRYLQNDDLLAMNIRSFDEWAATFGETVVSMEVAPEGNGYRPRTRFAKFYNLLELRTVFKKVADVQTADMLNLPRPKIHGDLPTVVVSSPSESLLSFVAQSVPRVQAIRDGMVKPTEDNMLKFTSDAKKAGTDMRLLDPSAPYDENGKIARCVELCFERYRESAAEKGVQIIFSDFSAPSKEHFSIPVELVNRLLEAGIPKEEICTIWQPNNEQERETMFHQLRTGEKRILIGSTQKCGAGTNIQDRLIALHHLDCPYRPSDIEQREGRILRRGNRFDEVYIYRYVTERSFDAYLWQIVEQKQRFISQIMTSKNPGRTCEDVDEAVLSFAAAKAISSGDPKIKEKIEVDEAIARLKIVQRGYQKERYALEDDCNHRLPKLIIQCKQKISALLTDIERAAENALDLFSIKLEETLFTEREAAGQRIKALSQKGVRENLPIGEFRGFSLLIHQKRVFDMLESQIIIKGADAYYVDVSESDLGCVTRIENAIKSFEGQLETKQSELRNLEATLAVARSQLKKPFEKEGELETLLVRQARLVFDLNLDQHKDEVASFEESEGERKAPDEKPEQLKQLPEPRAPLSI